MAVAQLALFATEFATDTLTAPSTGRQRVRRVTGRATQAPPLPLAVARRVQRGDVWACGAHRVCCGDSADPATVARLFAGKRAAMCFADPPYGMGIDAWDVPLKDIPAWLSLVASHLTPTAFLLVCQQMPYALAWLNALQASAFRYRDHVVWVKRNITGVALPLPRSHESIYVYSVGRKATYYQTKGRYEDVKLPGVLVDVTTLEGMDRHIKDLRAKVNGTSTPIHDNGYHHKKYAYYPVDSDRSSEMACYTNVWSFLPEHVKHRNGDHAQHATAKPVLLVERALALCSPAGAIVYDPFLGSGTTLIAAQHTGHVAYCCELSATHCDLALARWEAETGQHATRVTPCVTP